MSGERFDHMARRVEGDPHFLAAALAGYARVEGLSDEGLAERLGCGVEQLPHLKLCRRPDPASERFRDDIREIADRFRIGADLLASICQRFEQPAAALAGRAMPGDGASVTDQPAARYVGRRAEGGVQVVREARDGTQSPLPMRTDLRNHSPTGFEWGYGGSGPAQLALAVLADVLGATRAQGLYQDFKWKVITGLQGDGWTITREDVLNWLRGHEAGQDA